MAKGQRGRGGRQRQRGAGGAHLPGRRGRKQQSRAPRAEPPTAAPGSAQAPAGSSVFGGAATVPASPAVRRPQGPSRGGPRPRAERRSDRRAALIHDFRYVGADLRWIGLTTVVSGGLLLILWAVIRL